MLKNLRRMLVRSYIGTIALGYLLAECVLHFSYIFSAPIARWVSRDDYRALTANATFAGANPLRYALPEIARFVVLGLVWYVLLRWLYSNPLTEEPTEPSTVPE